MPAHFAQFFTISFSAVFSIYIEGKCDEKSKSQFYVKFEAKIVF